jgi:DNA-binding NarL/FixJ family response regulator
VDDSTAFLTAAVEVIGVTEGFEVVAVAQSGEQAVALVDSAHPDLVLIDVRMTGIDGREAAAQIRATSPQTAVVLMTADPGSIAAESAPVIDKRALSPAALAAAWTRAAPL